MEYNNSEERYGINESEMIEIVKAKGYKIPTFSNPDERIDYVGFLGIVSDIGYTLTKESRELQENGKFPKFYYEKY